MEIYHQDDWKLESAELRGEECGIQLRKERKMMLACDYSVDEASLITELPISEIRKLQN